MSCAGRGEAENEGGDGLSAGKWGRTRSLRGSMESQEGRREAGPGEKRQETVAETFPHLMRNTQTQVSKKRNKKSKPEAS